MKRNFIYLFISFALLFKMFSCTEIIDIELDSTYTRLVVYGTITTDLIRHEVRLTKSTDYFFTESPPPVSGAIVSVSDDNRTIILEEIPEYPGIYQFPMPFKGEPGTTYNLDITEVDIDGDGVTESYSASTKMPEIATPDSITLQKFITPFFSAYQVVLWSPEPDGRNWYNYKIIKNGILLNRRLSDFSVQPDDFVNNGYIAGLPVGFLNDDNEDEAALPGDIVTLEINSISQQYYHFITQAQSEIFGNNPLFSGPPANVSTNLDNNAQGIFTAYSVKRVSAVVAIPDSNAK